MTVPHGPETGAEVIARYLAGTLEPEAVEAFELHMVDCAACQRALRDGAVLRKVLRTSPARAAIASPSPARRRIRWVLPLAAAAGLATIWLAMPREGPLQRLGRLGPAPALAVLPVRGDADTAASLGRRGMDEYLAGRYRQAAQLFSASDSLEPTETVAFYRGVSALFGGDAAGAIVVLRRVMHSADDPYAAEAHFYSAKAWLRLGRADSALAHLSAIAAGSGAIAAHAAALTDSVKAVMQ